MVAALPDLKARPTAKAVQKEVKEPVSHRDELMKDRYSKLFSLTKDLYTEGSPIIISAGSLLKDNDTDRVLAQLKFTNRSTKDTLNKQHSKIKKFTPKQKKHFSLQE